MGRHAAPVENLRFLRFSNLLVEPGREPDLIRLMESLLHNAGAIHRKGSIPEGNTVGAMQYVDRA